MKSRAYSTVDWTIEEIKNMRPEWTYEHCEEFLDIFESEIQEEIKDLGYEVIRSKMEWGLD